MKTDKQYINEIYKKYENKKKENIYNALNEEFGKESMQKSKNTTRIYKVFTKIAAIFILIIVIAILNNNVVMARKVVQFNLSQENGVVDSGINTAIENDYLEDVEMETVVSNGIGLRVISVMMDDYNLYLKFEMSTEEDFDDNLMNIYLKKMILYDENNNIIYCNDIEVYKDFCKKNKIKYYEEEYYELGINAELETQIIHNYNTRAEFMCSFKTSKEFMKNRKINIKVGEISFMYYNLERLNSTQNNELLKDTQTINVKCYISFEISDEMYNRNYDIYKIENNPYVEVEYLKVENSRSKISLKINSKNLSFKNVKEILNKLKIVNENGIEYNFIDNGEFFADDNILNLFIDLTKYNITSNLKLKIIVGNNENTLELIKI